MPPYPLYCTTKGCGHLAKYKIAARWSDGITQELKTYALSCGNCLPRLFRQSREKQKACRLVAGETLAAPGIYLLQRGQKDSELEPRTDLERQLLEGETAAPASGIDEAL